MDIFAERFWGKFSVNIASIYSIQYVFVFLKENIFGSIKGVKYYDIYNMKYMYSVIL